ncbi:hypothetical protein [Aeromicrobium sp. Root236]|uniref:hypothetical protein n=1 Tax=Aeromicrobium sp. Root236 TaxID=1736498 RepID=UPI000ADB5866|nr:hypothetical protein [Aeromicrobium sp. Root236]
MRGIQTNDDGTIMVEGAERTLTYAPRLVTLDDGTTVAHESQGGEMTSVWAADLGGDWFVEVAHLGDGPVGGELVMTATHIGLDETVRYVTIGDLWADELPSVVPPSWPVAVDLALGLMEGEVHVVGADITKDDVETLHQRLLGALHG